MTFLATDWLDADAIIPTILTEAVGCRRLFLVAVPILLWIPLRGHRVSRNAFNRCAFSVYTALHWSKLPVTLSSICRHSWCVLLIETGLVQSWMRSSYSEAIDPSCDVCLSLFRSHVSKTTRSNFTQFLARDVIYTSRAYATMSVSVCLSVCDTLPRIAAAVLQAAVFSPCCLRADHLAPC